MPKSKISTRREFLVRASASGLLLALGVACREREPAAAEGAGDGAAEPPLRPNVWIELRRDGTVGFQCSKSEMGQGVRTALAMLIAEELDLELARVVPVQAVTLGRFGNGSILDTDSSASLARSWVPLRTAASRARELLVAAAGGTWGVAPAECDTEGGAVWHRPSGRRLAYVDLLDRAATLPLPPARPKSPKRFRLVGQPTRRLEGPEIARGTWRYGSDLRREGQLFAVVARSPDVDGRVQDFDRAAALAVPGVRAVVRIHSGVAVIADTTWQAMRGRDALAARFKPGPHAGWGSAEFTAAAEAALAGPVVVANETGDVDAALADPRGRIEARYETPFQTHAPMEPPNALVEVRGESCDVWCGTQWPNDARDQVIRRLKLPRRGVVVHPQPMGGSFGRKEFVDFVDEAAQVAAAVEGRPVQLLWTREDDLAFGRFHPASRHVLRARLDRAGRIAAWHHRLVSPSLEAIWSKKNAPPDRARTEATCASDLPYLVPHLRVEHAAIPVPVPLGYWRGVQAYYNVFAVESFVDELAASAGRDPYRFRLDALGPRRVFTHRKRTIDTGRLRGVLELAAERSGWGAPLPAGRGRGLAGYVFDGHSCCAVVAEVAVEGNAFRVARIVLALDCGQVVNPLGLAGNAESAVAWGLSALASELTFAHGAARESNFTDYPMLRMPQMPAVDVHLVPSHEPPSGTGEIPVPGVAPAVCNALFAVTGRRLRALPLEGIGWS